MNETMGKTNLDSANLGPPPPVSTGFQRSSSLDVGDRHSQPPLRMKSAPVPYGRGYSYPPPQYPSSRPPPHQIQSVVTTSFSMEEEREDGASRLSGAPGVPSLGHSGEYRSPMEDRHGDSREAPHHGRSPSHGREPSHHSREPPHHGREPPHYSRELAPVHESERERERHPPPHDMMRSRPMTVPPSPRLAGSERPPYIQRAHSAGAPTSSGYRGQGPLKRSFWHHARPGDEYQSSLPHEFMPPKRSKLSPSMRKDFVMTARPHPDEMLPSERHSAGSSRPPGWFSRAPSWETSEEYYHRVPKSKSFPPQWPRHSPSYREGEVGPHWSEAPPMPSPRTRYSPSEGSPQYERSAGPPWSHPRPGAWHPHSMSPESLSWRGPQNRDEAESKHHWTDSRDREGLEGEFRRQPTFEGAPETDSYHQHPVRLVGPPPPPHGIEHATASNLRRAHGYSSADGRKMTDGNVDSSDRSKSDGPIRLLALPEDRISLSETLCVVRENIEVFTATLNDVEAPAPGRKHAVVVGQVGLRCIHCRHTTRSSERVKRAVCYPSSIKRIYRTVIDMKLDHFLHCKFVPDRLKDTLAALKANNTRSTGTTMQYFIRAATTLGMVDGQSGVRLIENSQKAPMSLSPPSAPSRSQPNIQGSPSGTNKTLASAPGSGSKDGSQQNDCRIGRNNSMSSESTHSSIAMVEDTGNPKELFTGKITLALPEDKMSLSPLRCFLREQVCAFSATEEDIAVRTPTTFSVSVGQVGIGCIHCLTQPAKLRLNRAVCFPFSIARIYQSVADIQRFHLGECKMVPDKVKAEFLALQSASSKGSKGLATRQYWVTSAKKIGLVDTARGIRFGRDPSLPETKSISLDILAQVASNVTTVNKPLVLPEDRPFIAEFLYVVMEQLQPCRFTEADRNKRRLKDVGCIGVECKHCAGQVDSRKFFWSSVNAVESNFVSVHTHMMECRMIPDPLKEKLAELKKLRKEQTAALKTGSQKAFFSRVWKRLHVDEAQAPAAPAAQPAASSTQRASSDESVEKAASPTPSQSDKEQKQTQPPASPPASNVEAVSNKMAVVSV